MHLHTAAFLLLLPLLIPSSHAFVFPSSSPISKSATLHTSHRGIIFASPWPLLPLSIPTIRLQAETEGKGGGGGGGRGGGAGQKVAPAAAAAGVKEEEEEETIEFALEGKEGKLGGGGREGREGGREGGEEGWIG